MLFKIFSFCFCLLTLVSCHNLVKTRDSPTVYLIIDGQKHAFTNPKTYFNLISSWDKIKLLDHSLLDSIPHAQNVDDHSLLIKGKSPTVYLLQYGIKRPICSEKMF